MRGMRISSSFDDPGAIDGVHARDADVRVACRALRCACRRELMAHSDDGVCRASASPLPSCPLP